MSGDLGNLLTGELGEAEARFSHEDFAADFGKRIAGRVRRRRAVRAAGVGGGTMLTAGALAVGAMNIPWGVLGAAPGVGGSDCVSASPSDRTPNYSVIVDTTDKGLSEIVVSSTFTGTVILRGVQNSDGTYVFADRDGNSLLATPGSGGYYTVEVPSETGATESMTLVTVFPTGEGGMTRVDLPRVVDSAAPTSSPTVDCYTPSPTPSPAPSISTEIHYTAEASLAAKPDDVTSPFQCGFEFPTESFGTETQSIDGLAWFSPDEVNAQIKAAHPGSGSDIYQAVGDGAVPVVTVTDSFTSSLGEWVVGGGGAIDPAVALGEGDPDARANGVRTMHGSSFVAVANGVVVGTIVEPFVPSTAPPVYQRILGNPFDESLTLLNGDNAFTACAVATLDGDWDVYAVAGDVARESDGRMHGPDYFWLKVGKP